MSAPTGYNAKQKYDALKFMEAKGIKNAVKKFNCSEQTLYRWKRQFDGTLNSLENKYSRKGIKHPNSHTGEEVNWIKNILNQHPNITHKSLYEILKNNYGYKRHPGSLYNYLKRNKIIPAPNYKKDYATMFNSKAVKILNDKFLFESKKCLPLYLIEIDRRGIYIAKTENNNPCSVTVYYSLSLSFESKLEAQNFLKSIKNTSLYTLSIKEIEALRKT